MNTTTDQNELAILKRRGFLKLLSGAAVAAMTGIPTESTAASFINGEVVTSLSLNKLFNLQGLKSGSSGLIFYLKSEILTPEQKQVYVDANLWEPSDIPTIELSFEKTTVDVNQLQSGDATNSIKLFIDEVVNTLPVTNYDIYKASLSIAATSRRGAGNCIILHSSRQKDNFEQQYTRPMTFIYSDHIPKDKAIIWYNGHEFYDGVVTIAHDIEDIDKYMLVIHDCLPRYCRLINL
jgi:hypothetical protein